MAASPSKSSSKFLILYIIGTILIVPGVLQFVHSTIRDRQTQPFTLRRQLDMSRLPREQREKFVDTTMLYVLDPNEERIQVEWQVTDNLVQVSGIADRRTIQRLEACLKVIELQLPALHRIDYLRRKQVSLNKLKYLSRILEKYAHDYDQAFPDDLSDLHTYDSEGHLDWLIEHCEYLGRGKTLQDSLTTPLAYDKVLINVGEGTTVLFLDTLTIYAKPDELRELGIQPEH
jgi:hypothetical protein